MLINCPHCKAKVAGKELKDLHVRSDEAALSWRYTFLQCPECKSPLLVEQEEAGDGENWDPPRRVWPEMREFSYSIPRDIRDSLAEASRCCEGGTYTASVAMAGRALEGVVRHFTAPTMYLGPGLKELYAKKVIDDRLFDWAKALHLDRNDAAHSSGQVFGGDDAEDLLAFTIAICEYVFVIAARFKAFQERRAKSKNPAKS
jgi:uncharacterized protein YbaR (Trm112 family)